MMRRKDKDLIVKKNKDLKRAAEYIPDRSTKNGALMEVTNAVTLGAASLYRWEYDVKYANVSGTSPFNTSTKTNSQTMKALSVSELGNDANIFSYGVPLADIPAGFTPKRIPNGTPVWCVPWRKIDGTFFWLIINTQAISGTC